MFKDLISTSSLKKNFQKSLLVSSIALLAACGSDSDDNAVDPLPEGFTYSNNVTAEFRSDETYGTDTRNVFDIFLPESGTATPLIIYVHGGGFFTGDKSAAYSNPDDINEVLEAGVAYATINYSLLDVPGFNDATENDTVGIKKSLSDITEALQYIRHNAAEFNIAPDNIAMYGVSAGAVSSLWMAYSDDMADATAEEGSIARESTRIVAAGAIETQGSLDIAYWDTILQPTGQTLETAAPLTLRLMESFYGIANTGSDPTASIALIRDNSTELGAYRAKLNLPALMDMDDPAVFVSNTAVTVAGLTAAATALGTIQATAPGMTNDFNVATEEGRLDDAAALYNQLQELSANGAVAASGVINSLLHFPTHAATILAGSATGAVVTANIPELGDYNPTGQTVIPFLLEEINDFNAAQP